MNEDLIKYLPYYQPYQYCDSAILSVHLILSKLKYLFSVLEFRLTSV